MSNDADRSLEGAPLGKRSEHVDNYEPALLFAVPRAASRRAAGIGEPLPFRGVDLWTAWELSWLDRRGKPSVAALRMSVPATTDSIVESKSLKLYLGSFAQSRFDSAEEVAHLVRTDLHAVIGHGVEVEIPVGPALTGLRVTPWRGESIDGLDVDVEHYEPDASLLSLAAGPGGAPDDVVEETLCSDLLRSTCPVTGQPDVGSVQVSYRGPRIDRASLLRYVVSYRRHAGFHESCVERMWSDIRRVCRTESLTVYARYLRRGGIDINPFRSDTRDRPAEDVRLARQ